MLTEQPVDELTALPLRGAFVATAADAIATARASQGECALLVIDVDQFKQVNDTYGHLKGDAVLVLVAELLRHTLRGGDIAARWGGDEFVALLPGAPISRARATWPNGSRRQSGGMAALVTPARRRSRSR